MLASPLPRLDDPTLIPLATAAWFGDLHDLLLESELATLTRIAPGTLQWWRQSGTGPRFQRMGRLVRYPLVEVLTWINAGRVIPSEYPILPEHITPGPMLTDAEVAAQLRAEPSTLRRWRWAGRELAYFKLGTDAVRYTQTDVNAYLASRTLAHTN